jgi:hypothetical protein
MIGLAIAAAFGAAAVTVVVARAIAGRAERRSIQGYERVLDTLGDVTRRSDARAQVHLPTKAELAQPHVRGPSEVDGTSHTPPIDLKESPRTAPISASDRRLVFTDVAYVEGPHPQPEEVSRTRGGKVLRGGRAALAAGVVPTHSGADGPPVLHFDDDDVRPATRRSTAGSDRGAANKTQLRVSRRPVGLVVVALVVLGGIGVGVWRAVDSPAGPRRASAPLRPTPSHQTPPPPSTAIPTVFHPATVTTAQVAFDVPTGALHITFVSTGASWMGIFHGAVSNPTYEWMDTLSTNQSASFDAHGTTYLRLGNPPQTKVTVNGIPLDLPADKVLPYNVELVSKS